MRKFLPSFLFGSALLGSSAFTLQAQPVFSDDFDTDSSSQWSVFDGSGDGVSDYTVEFSFDYSAHGIPPAPSSGGGTTRGVKMTVNNNDDVANAAAVNIYPTGKSFNGDFVVKFDMWLNYNGGAFGGTGSTEFAIFGVNHLGTQLNWAAPAAAPLPSSDGIFFAITGEGGAAGDYRIYGGDPAGSPARDNAATFPNYFPIYNFGSEASPSLTDTPLTALFPTPKFQTPGAPGKAWVRVEIVHYQGNINVKLNGNEIISGVNESDYTSGNIMLGYMDIFNSIANPREENFVIYDNLRIGRIVTVTTADNNSTAGDGQTSLVEALADARTDDTIAFNIAGGGRHYLETPADGYPLITVDNLTIDGYTQPESAPNSNPFLDGNNASIGIVLDSRNKGRRVLDYPGYGTSESAILGVLIAKNVTIKGLGFLAVMPEESDEDPSIYGVSFVGDSDGGQVSGCWFGVDPADGSTLGSMSDGVTAFRYRIDGQPDIFADNIVVGTRGEGPDSVKDFNIFGGLKIPVIFEGTGYKISGNYFGVQPDGLTEINNGLLGIPFEGHIEIGRDGSNMVIGTDGDGHADAHERNIFGGVTPEAYETVIEYYGGGSPNKNMVIAGNYFGIGRDGFTRFTTSSRIVNSFRNTATVQFGSDFDGISDDLEGNLIYGNYPVATFFPDPANSVMPPFIGTQAGAQVSLRGNILVNQYVPPFSPIETGFTEYYTPFAAEPSLVTPIVTAESDTTFLSGSVTVGTAEYPHILIDVYRPNLESLQTGIAFAFPEFPLGFPQSDEYLGSFEEGSDQDLDPAPGTFKFQIAKFGLLAGDQVTVSATWSKQALGTHRADGHTSTFSTPVALLQGELPDLVITGLVAEGNSATLSWSGGVGPYTIQKKSVINADIWEDVLTTEDTSAQVNLDGLEGYFRVIW